MTFKLEHNEFLINKLSEVPPEKFVAREIECIYELAKFSMRSSNYALKANETLWKIACEDLGYPETIVELASDKFCEIIRHWDRENKVTYFIRCVENIKIHKAGMMSLRIIKKMLD